MDRFNEVIEIIAKTGDKCVILKDSHAFVVMMIEQYRKLLEKAEKAEQLSYHLPDFDIKEFELADQDKYYAEPLD